MDLPAARKILVVKLDFIGDWVLTTPFLAGLRRAAPNAAITAVVLERVYDLAAPCQLIDRIIAVPAAAEGAVQFGAASREDLDLFLADIRSSAFDLALVPRWDTDFNGATRIAGLAGAAHVVGFSERCTERKQVENRGFDRYLSVALLDLRDCHEVEHTGGFLDALGAPREARLRLDLASADHAAAAAFRAANFREPSRPLLAVGPFAAGRRQWPLDRSATLASRLARAMNLDVVVIGGPNDAAEARALAGRIKVDGVQAASAAGVLNLRESAALIGMAALFIGMDSGPGHIAAALGVPVVVVSAHPPGASPKHPGAPERFGPWADPSRVLILRTPAHRPPCSDGCEADTPHCILGIDVEDAVARVGGFAAAVLANRA
ncbi:MAG TPA: glycosyltransferase family 9 protein [Bauldia sp.]|nr:glycosyltransferase family 9 protein [Bauldia sp.]